MQMIAKKLLIACLFHKSKDSTTTKKYKKKAYHYLIICQVEREREENKIFSCFKATEKNEQTFKTTIDSYLSLSYFFF